jgi:hypothetical protein
MPSILSYLSDASLSSDEDSEDETEPLYSERELDYWAIESLLEKRGPPPVIEYVTTIGSVALRESVIGPLQNDICSVVDLSDSYSWKSYWTSRKEIGGRFSLDDWDAIGEFCFSLCLCCIQDPTMERVRSCIIRIVGHGKFKSNV